MGMRQYAAKDSWRPRPRDRGRARVITAPAMLFAAAIRPF